MNPSNFTTVVVRCDKDKADMTHRISDMKLVSVERKVGDAVTSRANADIVGPHTTVHIWRKGSRTYCNNGKGLNMQIHHDPTPAVDAAAEGYKLGHADGFHDGLIFGLVIAFVLGGLGFVAAMVFA